MSDDKKAKDRLYAFIDEAKAEPKEPEARAEADEPEPEGEGHFETSYPDPDPGEVSNQPSHPAPECQSPQQPPRRKMPPLAIGLAAAASVALVAVVGLIVYFADDDAPSSPAASTTSPRPSALVPRGHAARSTSTTEPATDAAIPGVVLDDRKTAAGPRTCPEGSSPPSFATDGDPTHAFICLRNGAIGQVFYIRLGNTYRVSSISGVFGALGVGRDGKPQYWQNRVITKARAICPNPLAPDDPASARVVDLDPPPVPVAYVKTIDPPMLCSTITLQILETGTPPPPVAPTDDATPTDGPGVFGNVPLVPTTSATEGDPTVSDSIAISSLTVQGHLPQ